MFQPKNEQGLIALFCMQIHNSEWEIVSIDTLFPDAVLRHGGVEWRVEFEFKASNFVAHRHDFTECDLIVCWEDDLPDFVLPVIELRNPAWVTQCPVKANYDMVDEVYAEHQEYFSQRRILNAMLKQDRKAAKSLGWSKDRLATLRHRRLSKFNAVYSD